MLHSPTPFPHSAFTIAIALNAMETRQHLTIILGYPVTMDDGQVLTRFHCIKSNRNRE